MGDGNQIHAKVFTLDRQEVDDVDLTPILGEIVRQWRQINLYDLSAPEALRLLGALMDITERIEPKESYDDESR
ncbi:hypothetical protein [Mycobacterium sp. DL592]|uniref:hypothetical protein n=1 Tax=Mycobacterium sp. DL592 TaxID=2675524 RepID=UPI00141E693F|nr:hypothetical protein [Mycobacterium sp. DL592]